MVTKIGLLLDSWRIPVWQKHIIEFILSNPSFSIEFVVLNKSRTIQSQGRLVYRILRRIDRAVFTPKYDCFHRVDVSSLLNTTEVIPVSPVCCAFTDEFRESDLAVIRRIDADVLIRFGFRILKGDILQASRYGVWSLHHGDNTVNRGGPPAFWEVVKGEPVTGVTLQKLSTDLDGGQVLGRSFVRTDRTSFIRNQSAVYWAGVELFCSTLHRVATHLATSIPGDSNTDPAELINPENTLPTSNSFYSAPLYRDPRNGAALLILLSFWLRRTKELLLSFVNRPRWMLYYAMKNDAVETSLFRYKKLPSPRGTDWADPFIVWRDNRYVVFFEELIHRQKKGHISCFEFNEAGKLLTAKPRIVLEEAHHLSYPSILEHEGNLYMIPEAASCKDVWLYQCEEFPGRWKKLKLLLTDTALFDPTVVLHDGTWYLFGTQKPLKGNSADQYLYIYYSEDLFSSSWQAHPQNPVTRDVHGARPAGNIFRNEGRLIRPGQIGAPNYGYGIRFYEIVKLTRKEYEQRPLNDILPHWKKGLLATHTFNTINRLSFIDAQHTS